MPILTILYSVRNTIQMNLVVVYFPFMVYMNQSCKDFKHTNAQQSRKYYAILADVPMKMTSF